MKTSQPPILNRSLRTFLFAIALAEFAYTLTMVQIPVYLVELGADVVDIGTFFSIALITPMLLQFFGGWLSDGLGRMRIIAVGSLAGVLTYIPYLSATSWQGAIPGQIFRAISTAFILPSYRAYLADNSSPDVRGRVFGAAESIRSLAWVIGPPLGGIIAQTWGSRWCFALALLTSSIASLLFLALNKKLGPSRATPEERFGWTTLKRSLTEMGVLFLSGGLVTWLFVTDGIRDISFHISFDLMPVYLTNVAGITKQAIGFLDGIHGVAWTVTCLGAGWLIDKTSERLGVVLGLVALISSPLIFAFASSFNSFMLSWILLGVGGALLDPALNAIVARGVPSRLRGVTYALIATSLGLISLPFPWIGSQLWNRYGPRIPFLTTVVLASLALIPAWMKLRIPDSQPDKGSGALTQ